MGNLRQNPTVRAIGRRVRNALLAAASSIERRAGSGRVMAKDGSTPFSYVDPSFIETTFARLRIDPTQLLQIANVRKDLARERIKTLVADGKLRKAEEGAKVSHNTIGHNLEQIVDNDKADMDRPIVMVNAVKAIERVVQDPGSFDVLTIGPRSEIEIFSLLSAGFNADRLRALDLLSYSPYVEVGDMHAMPYADNSFDIVFVGWVLSYSRDQQAAAREILRVARNGAILVIAGTYSDESTDQTKFKDDTTHMQSCSQIEGLFEGHVAHAYFRHDPKPPVTTMVMTVFEIRK